MKNTKLGMHGKQGCGCLILLVGFPMLFFLSFFGCSCDCIPIDKKPTEVTNTIEEVPTMITVNERLIPCQARNV